MLGCSQSHKPTELVQEFRRQKSLGPEPEGGILQAVGQVLA